MVVKKKSIKPLKKTTNKKFLRNRSTLIGTSMFSLALVLYFVNIIMVMPNLKEFPQAIYALILHIVIIFITGFFIYKIYKKNMWAIISHLNLTIMLNLLNYSTLIEFLYSGRFGVFILSILSIVLNIGGYIFCFSNQEKL